MYYFIIPYLIFDFKVYCILKIYRSNEVPPTTLPACESPSAMNLDVNLIPDVVPQLIPTNQTNLHQSHGNNQTDRYEMISFILFIDIQ